MKHSIILITLLLIAGAMSCQKYEKAPENSSICVIASASDEGAKGVLLKVAVKEGVIGGDAALSVDVLAEDNSSPEYTLSKDGGSAMDAGDAFSFDEKGEAAFRIEGLPAGHYRIAAHVTRWYHTSTARCEVDVH